MDESQFCEWSSETERRLSGLDERLSRWMDMPIDVNRLEEEIARIAEVRAQSAEYQGMLGDLYQAIEDLCRTYLEADSGQRIEVRELVSTHENVLQSLTACIDHATERLGATQDPEWLRIGLAVASIENASIDMRDTILALERLYREAQGLGIDPRGCFEEVARLSSNQPAPGALASASMRELLLRFHERV